MIALITITDKKDCSGCYACSNKCPRNCISMQQDFEGFWYPKVDYDLCIKCELCIQTCPIINRTTVTNEPTAYACINKDEPVRLESSSGGLFSVFAERIIEEGGVVFGAGFDRDFAVAHSFIEKKEELSCLRGAKYVQSRIGWSYRNAETFLNQGRSVLFTGTPCQIGGLKSYLAKDYDNLYCIDIVCHGVPSPKVLETYISYQEKSAGASTQRITFRGKNEGWRQYSVSFHFDNGTEYRQTLDKDLYMRAFLSNACLRPSCNACRFKTLHRESDITLADFWGIQSVLPDMDDNKGTSLIFVNSIKGRNIFEQIKKSIEYKEVDINQAVGYNTSAIVSAEQNPKRQDFFLRLNEIPFDRLVKKYSSDSIYFRMRRKVRTIIGKVFDLF